MKPRTFDELVRHLQDQREMGEPSPVVLLGAGASQEVGIEDMKGLYALVGAADFDAFVTYIADRSVAERYALLGRYLSTKQPELITDGYRALATLCARAFFDVVLTTNLDPLMDDALVEADLWRRDYVLLVNGLLRSERLGPVLASRHPRVKIVKLHGDLYLRFMAWTPDEMDEYLEDIEPYLAAMLRGREVLVVGQSLRDERIRQLVVSTGGLVWFATPGPAPDHLLATASRWPWQQVPRPDSRQERSPAYNSGPSTLHRSVPSRASSRSERGWRVARAALRSWTIRCTWSGSSRPGAPIPTTRGPSCCRQHNGQTVSTD